MQRTPIRKRTRAKALTDPQPNFVSLVRTGANMTPLLAIKAAEQDDGDVEMNVQRSSDHGIASFEFSKEVYKDEASVKSWLDAGGFADYEIVEGEAAFTVKGEEGLDEDVTAVEKDGVTTYVGKRVIEEASEKTEDELAAEAEATSGLVVAAKDDGSTEDEVNPVAKEDEPTDVDAISALVAKGMAEPAKKDSYTMSWVGDIASMVASLVYNAEYMGLSEKATDSLRDAGNALLVALKDVSDETIAELGEMFTAKADEVVEEVAEEAAKEETVEEAAAEEPAAPEENPEISALKAQVTDLAKLVETLVAAKAEPEAPVIPLDETRQTRRSAVVENEQAEAPVPAKKTSDTEYVEELRRRNMLGI